MVVSAVETGFIVFSRACFILSEFSVIGPVSKSMKSLPNFETSSAAPAIGVAYRPIKSAEICFASSLLKTEKISATAIENCPTISFISEPMSNIEMNHSFIRPLFCSRYRAIPPVILSAIVAPIDASDPTTLPRFNARLST